MRVSLRFMVRAIVVLKVLVRSKLIRIETLELGLRVVAQLSGRLPLVWVRIGALLSVSLGWISVVEMMILLLVFVVRISVCFTWFVVLHILTWICVLLVTCWFLLMPCVMLCGGYDVAVVLSLVCYCADCNFCEFVVG